MKAKHLIPIIFITACLMTGCYVEPISHTTYIYKNQTSKDITIKSYSPIYYDGGIDHGEYSTFVIEVNGSYKIYWPTDYSRFPREPFTWLPNPSADHDTTIVSNSISEIIERRRDNSTLYNTDNYRVVSSKPKKRSWTYEYIFTDEYFENAE